MYVPPSHRQLTIHVPSLSPPRWECRSIHHHHKLASADEPGQHVAFPCHPPQGCDGSIPSGIGKYKQYYRLVRPVAVENRKNTDSGLNNMTSNRMIGRQLIRLVNLFTQPTSYLLCRRQCCRLELFRDDDDATIGRRSCDQLQCTFRDDHVEFDAECLDMILCDHSWYGSNARLFGRFEMPAEGTEFSAKCNYAVVRRPDQPCAENQMGWKNILLWCSVSILRFYI